MSQFKYALSEQDYDNLKNACNGLYAYIHALDCSVETDKNKQSSIDLLFILHKQLEENIHKMQINED